MTSSGEGIYSPSDFLAYLAYLYKFNSSFFFSNKSLANLESDIYKTFLVNISSYYYLADLIIPPPA